MGRVRAEIWLNGRAYWTLFDSGAENTYVVPEVSKVLGARKLARPWPARLGGRRHRILEDCRLEATIGGRFIFVEAYVVDKIGIDKRSRPPRPFEVLIGALAMQKWGIELNLGRERLDLAGYTKEFVEF